MAAISNLGNATFSTAAGGKTVIATPAVDDLIVIVTAHSGNTNATAPTDNNPDGLGTYTNVRTAVKNASADTMMVWVRNSLIGNAASTTFTHTPAAATTGGGLTVLKVTGMQNAGSAAVAKSGLQTNQAAAGTPAPSLGGTPSVSNPIIAAVFNGTNPSNLTPRTDYIEYRDLGYNTPSSGLNVMGRNSGETSGTITWGSSSASAFSSIALELAAPVPAEKSRTFIF